jgi:hypothetical protein
MNLSTRAILLIGFVSLAGCTTTPPTFGERILSEGESRVEIAAQWDEGNEMSIEGTKDVESGTKLVEKGQSYLTKGEKLITSGNLKIQTNKQSYQTVIKTTLGVTTGTLAMEQVAKLNKIAKAWKDGEEDVVDGNKLIKRGNESISEGQADIAEGQKLVSKGQEIMASAESLYNN